jgi:hypothetical protein
MLLASIWTGTRFVSSLRGTSGVCMTKASVADAVRAAPAITLLSAVSTSMDGGAFPPKLTQAPRLRMTGKANMRALDNFLNIIFASCCQVDNRAMPAR